MNFIAIGLTSFVALVIITLLLSRGPGLKMPWASADARRNAIEEQRKNQILKG
jgi:hypothetical protein